LGVKGDGNTIFFVCGISFFYYSRLYAISQNSPPFSPQKYIIEGAVQ
jgi:hypothetical protein